VQRTGKKLGKSEGRRHRFAMNRAAPQFGGARPMVLAVTSTRVSSRRSALQPATALSVKAAEAVILISPSPKPSIQADDRDPRRSPASSRACSIDGAEVNTGFRL
jgi:hypothetical protein